MRATYTGQEALTFNDYMDLETGKTLFAEPGGVYDIAPASGHNVDDIPASWFVPAEASAKGRAASKSDPEPKGAGKG